MKVTDRFEQKDSGGQVDVLFVIDNSDSMLVDFQLGIAEKFRGFVNHLQGLDFHIGVTTTDMTSPKGYPGYGGRLDRIRGTEEFYIQSSTPNAEEKLVSTIRRNETLNCRKDNPHLVEKLTSPIEIMAGVFCGVNIEEPLKATRDAVRGQATYNHGFFRDQSDFVMIAVSDADEGGSGREVFRRLVKPQELIDTVAEEFQGQKNFTGYGIIVQPEDKECLKSQKDQQFLSQVYYGTYVSDLAQKTSGFTLSICKEEGYAQALKAVADKVRSRGLEKIFTLSQEPIPESLEIRITPSTGIQWRVEGRRIIFESAPPIGSLIEISYLPKL